MTNHWTNDQFAIEFIVWRRTHSSYWGTSRLYQPIIELDRYG